MASYLNVWRGRRVLCGALAVLLIGLMGGGTAEETATKRPLQWVGLFGSEVIEWLEHPNSRQYTRHTMKNNDFANNEDAWLNPKSWTLEVKEQPNRESVSMGKIVITATPGKGMTVFFFETATSKITFFTPDLYESDWGYGPYFHQTFLQRSDMWFQLPKNPLPAPGWVDFAGYNDSPDVLSVTEGRVYMMEEESVVITGSDQEAVFLRLEQEGDMWCDANAPPIQPSEIRRIPYAEMYTPDGHLRLHVKYTRGC